MATRKKMEEVPTMRTGCDLLDLLIGGDKGVYGMPFGYILNVAGDKSSGKSFIKNEIIAANYWALKDGLQWFSDDCESGDTFDTQRLYGVTVHPENQRIGTKVQEDSATLEEMDAKVSLFRQGIAPGQYGIYAVDSLNGLSDASMEAMAANRLKQLKEGDEVVDPGSYGTQAAAFLSQKFFKPQHKKLKDARVSLILITQIREKTDAKPYGQKYVTSIGKALEFYCHTRVFLRTVCQIKKGDRVIGAYVEATTNKSKTPRPYRKVYYTVYFDYGLDNIGSNLDYLFDLRDEKGKLRQQPCSAIPWSADSRSKNLENLKAWLEANGWEKECKDAKKAAGSGTNLSIQWILDWAAQDPARQESLDREFGQEYTRDQLIEMCDSDPAMAAELTRRVRERWEAEEEAVATHRPAKYGRG